MSEETLLREFAGQRCDVLICTRNNGSQYVTFKSQTGYGYPSLERDQLVELLRRMNVQVPR